MSLLLSEAAATALAAARLPMTKLRQPTDQADAVAAICDLLCAVQLICRAASRMEGQEPVADALTLRCAEVAETIGGEVARLLEDGLGAVR